MTKHIAGIILFTFIVGTSAVIAGFFYEAPTKVKSYSFGYERNHCKKKKRRKRRRHRRPRVVLKSASSNLVSAVYDRRTGLFTASLASRVYDSRTRNLSKVAYAFFVKDEFNTRFVGSATAQGSNISTSFVKDLNLLRAQGRNGSLYVMIVNSPSRVLEAPKFNSRLAVPVLIKNGN